MFGKPCCRQRVWRPRSLSFGLGEKLNHGNPKLVDTFYGEWEIGTYYCAWRVIQKGRIILGSSEVVDSVDELDESLKRIEFGSILSLTQQGAFDVRAEFDMGLAVEFLTTTNHDDESFHIFGPQNLYIEFSIRGGWTKRRADKPVP